MFVQSFCSIFCLMTITLFDHYLHYQSIHTVNRQNIARPVTLKIKSTTLKPNQSIHKNYHQTKNRHQPIVIKRIIKTSFNKSDLLFYCKYDKLSVYLLIEWAC